MVADQSAGLHALTPTVDGIWEVKSILDEGCKWLPCRMMYGRNWDYHWTLQSRSHYNQPIMRVTGQKGSVIMFLWFWWSRSSASSACGQKCSLWYSIGKTFQHSHRIQDWTIILIEINLSLSLIQIPERQLLFQLIKEETLILAGQMDTSALSLIFMNLVPSLNANFP